VSFIEFNRRFPTGITNLPTITRVYKNRDCLFHMDLWCVSRYESAIYFADQNRLTLQCRHITMMIKKITSRVVFVLLSMMLSLQASASPQDLMTNLHKMQLLSSMAVANYHLFAGLDADAKYGNRLKKNLDEFQTLLVETTDIPTADKYGADVKAINKDWMVFKDLVNSNYQDMMDQGFPDVKRVSDADFANRDLLRDLSQLYTKTSEENNVKVSQEASLARSLSLLMQQINTQYAARGSTNLGQVFNGNFERTLEDLGAEFETKLKQLKQVATRASDKSLISSINSKWLFIGRSIANYNENSVIFLVSSYSERITMNLEKIAEMHSK